MHWQTVRRSRTEEGKAEKHYTSYVELLLSLRHACRATQFVENKSAIIDVLAANLPLDRMNYGCDVLASLNTPIFACANGFCLFVCSPKQS